MIRDRRAILALLTALNFLNYIDRAVLAAVLKPLSVELGLSRLEGGLLSTAFLAGYFVLSPLFGARADKGARKGLITIGIAVWSAATVASGMAQTFGQLFAARVVVGIGEASFVALAPTIIDDITPPDRKGRALAVFFLALPLGYALGYIIGGALSQHLGWRGAFFATGGPGIALALTVLLVEEPKRKLIEAKERLIDGLRELVRIPLFRRITLGYAMYTGALGAFSQWAPFYLLERYPGSLNEQSANFGFGVVLLAAGAVGTFTGGRWTDRAVQRLPQPAAGARFDVPEQRRHVNAMLKICAIGMAIAAPLAVVCFLMPTSTGFFATVFVVQVAAFLSTSPVAAAGLRAVPEERRASGVAATMFAIHLLGDLWTPPALGLLQDAMPPVLAMMALPLTFALNALVWWPRAREAAGSITGTGGRGLPEARVHT